ncbi:MAG: fructose 1,6-bisphosphatase, partial [Candidatus Micrarchaeota archaeon]
PSFDHTRRVASDAMEYMRRHGAFEPHRLHLSEMEYTTMPEVMKEIAHRFEPI